jgi:hypothetical protein
MNKLVRFFMMATMAFTMFACDEDEKTEVVLTAPSFVRTV